MAHIRLADLTNEETTVDIFDNVYRVRAITRSVQKNLEKVAPLLDGLAEEEDSDKVVATLSGAMEALLAPVDPAPPAKKVLLEAWKQDRLDLTQIKGLFEHVQEASVARPT